MSKPLHELSFAELMAQLESLTKPSEAEAVIQTAYLEDWHDRVSRVCPELDS